MKTLLRHIEVFKSFVTSLHAFQSDCLSSLNQIQLQFADDFTHNKERILQSVLTNVYSLFKSICQILQMFLMSFIAKHFQHHLNI